MAARRSSAAWLWAALVVVGVWASIATAFVEIVAETPSEFTAHCKIISGDTVRQDFGVLHMRALPKSGPYPVLQSFTFPEDPTVHRINCHFRYTTEAGYPVHQDIDVLGAESPAAGLDGASSVWYVDSDGFYLQIGSMGKQFTFRWLPGTGSSLAH